MSLALRARVARAMMELAFNPHQTRDSKGRWAKMPDSELKQPRRAKKPKAGKADDGAAKKAALKKAIDEGVTDGQPRPLDDADRAAIADMFSMDDPATGFRVQVGNTRSMPGGLDGSNKLWVPIEVVNHDGDVVGRATRYISRDKDGGLEVEHALFVMSPEVQGGGFSSRWLRQMEQRYKDAGIKRINIKTDMVGGYAWAKAGFDFINDAYARGIAERVNASVTFNPIAPAEVKAQAAELKRRAKIGGDERPTPMEFAMVGWTPGAETWPGKQAMIGSNWTGVKEL